MVQKYSKEQKVVISEPVQKLDWYVFKTFLLKKEESVGSESGLKQKWRSL